MPLRSLHFGPDGGGLVTFLVYPPDDLVLVVKIQWLGVSNVWLSSGGLTPPGTRAAEPAGAGEVAEDDCARHVSAAPEPVKAVEDEVEPVRERGGVIAWSQGAVVSDREGHFHDVGMASA